MLTNRHLLICGQPLDYSPALQQEATYLLTNFCGQVITELTELNLSADQQIYLMGDLFTLPLNQLVKLTDRPIYVIEELANNFTELTFNYQLIKLGQVPINLHGLGVYFRQYWTASDYFSRLTAAHHFQNLTESTKPGQAFRSGLYLTQVTGHQEQIHFNLLLCSTNLTGPTDNFRAVDQEIVQTVNQLTSAFFAQPVKLNHVLAQIYQNYVQIVGARTVEKKAVIKAHSDKTKDMPAEAVMAFVTFYQGLAPQSKKSTDYFDHCYKQTSRLTRLHFRLKPDVIDSTLVKEFTLTLYPNSIFIMPLSTNRLYTHEIKASLLPIEHLPTRLGYVVRCSNTPAIFQHGQTYLARDGQLIELQAASPSDLVQLKELYLRENTTSQSINYGPTNFSLNQGDYQAPLL